MTLFSERHGYKKKKILKPDEIPDAVRRRIWHIFDMHVFNIHIINDPIGGFSEIQARFITILWDRFFKYDIDEIRGVGARFISMKIKEVYNRLQWFEIFDFIEFFFKNFNNNYSLQKVLKGISEIFEEEGVPYNIIDGKIITLISDVEIKEIENAINIPDLFQPVKNHLSKALELFSQRPKPDYENSIKESISAVESFVQISLGKKGTLVKLIDKLKIHPQMKQGFKNLYNWTSDDSGIRHGESGKSFPCDESEARYMLITCSSFINYLIAKKSKTDIP